MKKYISASVTDIELDRSIVTDIEIKLYKLVRQYFNDTLSTDGVRVTSSTYDILKYTARPYSRYSGSSAKPTINAGDIDKLNEFRAAVRSYLKQYGVTRVKFDFKQYKIHYGYISGPDDFPVKELRAIYFG